MHTLFDFNLFMFQIKQKCNFEIRLKEKKSENKPRINNEIAWHAWTCSYIIYFFYVCV